MRRKLPALLAGAFLAAALVVPVLHTHAGSAEPQPLWTLTAPFESPESAVLSHSHDMIFVSNVNGYEENGEGFISSGSAEGRLLEREWLKDLNAPTGLAVDGDTLWAVDFNRLAEIDIPSRQVRQFYPAPDAKPLLNDVAVTAGGEVFVTGSASNTVYILQDGSLNVWMKDDDLLQSANGIHAEADHIVVAAYHLIRIDRKTRETRKLGDISRLFDLEGVKPDGTGGYVVSMIGPRPLYHVLPGGKMRELLTPEMFIADFDLDLETGLLVAPVSSDSIAAFKLPGFGTP